MYYMSNIPRQNKDFCHEKINHPLDNFQVSYTKNQRLSMRHVSTTSLKTTRHISLTSPWNALLSVSDKVRRRRVPFDSSAVQKKKYYYSNLYLGV